MYHERGYWCKIRKSGILVTSVVAGALPRTFNIQHNRTGKRQKARIHMNCCVILKGGRSIRPHYQYTLRILFEGNNNESVRCRLSMLPLYPDAATITHRTEHVLHWTLKPLNNSKNEIISVAQQNTFMIISFNLGIDISDLIQLKQRVYV